MNKLSLHKKVQIITLLVEGNSLRAISRITGTSLTAISSLLAHVGSFCIGFHNTHVRSVRARRVQCDEIWSFIYSKAKNVPKNKVGKAGDMWTWIAFDPDTKLVISWLVAGREKNAAIGLMEDLKNRITNRIQLTTDGLLFYKEAVENAFHGNVDFARLDKVYKYEHRGERRYSPSKTVYITKQNVFGSPDPDYVSTSLIERQNLTMRMCMRRFTRLTNGFSKKFIYHKYAVALHFVYYNFCRIHSTIRVTPAMEAGLTNDILEIEQLVKLADD